jgi:hypothetical protein
MKMTYIIIGIILTGGLVLGLMSYRNKSVTGNDKQISKNLETTDTKIQQAKENPFEELRNRAFKTTPEDLELSLPDNKTVVYGVIMDWEMGGAVATTVSYQTGDASLYLSSGGGVIGGGQHQNVNSAAKQFVNLAQTFIGIAIRTETTPLPEKNVVKFYLLTNKGIYVGQEEMKNFENNSSTWIKLFEEGNNVLSELRSISEK